MPRSQGRLNNTAGTLAQLHAAGQSTQQALMSVDNIVQTQSVMLGTNNIFAVVAVIVACVSAGIWLIPKPKKLARAGGGH